MFAELDEGAGAGQLDYVRPFVAPVAARAALVEDDLSLRLTEAIHAAFGEAASDKGLSRSEIAAACAHIASGETFEARFNVFVAMDMLRGPRDKPHEARYVFNPTSGAGLLVFERLAEDGGVEEIVTLLGRTHDRLQQGLLDEGQLATRLRQARHELVINTSHLLLLVRSRAIEELIAERRHHRSKDALLDHARQLVGAVRAQFPLLRSAGTRLIEAALRYSAAVDEFHERLLQQAGSKRDFSMLLPEQYVTAARRSSLDALAEVFAATVFDPASVQITAAQVLTAAAERRPSAPRRRPPRPAALAPGPDPVEAAREKAKMLRQRREASMQFWLNGGQEAELTSSLQALQWPAAISAVVDLLQASADPSVPYFVEVSKALAVSSDGPVTYATPLSVYRVPQDASGAAGESVDQEDSQ
ncbi:hypothetical protein [Streptomyces sp. NBC_01236]|uniref:hypothetical protein n=1 Tax=Streptomyces sp. NBC_01236 TaxID=2903789 RepID=UPI002E15EB7D|nr:hypothetical protein OG324_40930 [Streptomyces sp. NBC_01236]